MKKKNVLWFCVVLMMAFGMSSCSSDDSIEGQNDPASEIPIVGTWELNTLGYPGFDYEIPLDDRDLFIFNSNGKLKVIKKKRSFFPDFPNEDGEYDYSYDKKKQIIQLCGVARECIISNGEMHIDGYHEADSEPVQRFIFIKKAGRESGGEFVEPVNDEPEFLEGTGQNPRHESAMKTTESNGAEITRDSDGGIKWISFMGNSNAAPASAKDLFGKYMKLDLEENFRLYRQETEDWMEDPLTLECYQQQYKGVIVFGAGYNVRFRHGKVNDCNGLYVKIDNLDITPAFDLQKAKEIFAKYLKVPVEEIGAGNIMAWFDDALMIVEFPASKGSSQWAPRLVYGLYSTMEYAFVDAHTGRILQTWPTWID